MNTPRPSIPGSGPQKQLQLFCSTLMSCLSHNEQFDMQTQNRTLKVKLIAVLPLSWWEGNYLPSTLQHWGRPCIQELDTGRGLRTGLKREMCHQHRTASMTSEYRIWDSPAGLHAHYFYILHMPEVYRGSSYLRRKSLGCRRRIPYWIRPPGHKSLQWCLLSELTAPVLLLPALYQQ